MMYRVTTTAVVVYLRANSERPIGGCFEYEQAISRQENRGAVDPARWEAAYRRGRSASIEEAAARGGQRAVQPEAPPYDAASMQQTP